MLIDHIGVIFFPEALVLRAVGRLAMPIFAFMISEGTRYTGSRTRYLLTISLTGIAIQIPYSLFSGIWHINIFLTFSLSIILIYLLDLFKRALLSEQSLIRKALSFLPFLLFSALVITAITVQDRVHFDYELCGVFAPVFASIPSLKGAGNNALMRFDRLGIRVLLSFIPILLYAIYISSYQYFAILSLPLLLLYSGKRGKARLKYLFYVFYPLHLLVLYGISLLCA